MPQNPPELVGAYGVAPHAPGFQAAEPCGGAEKMIGRRVRQSVVAPWPGGICKSGEVRGTLARRTRDPDHLSCGVIRAGQRHIDTRAQGGGSPLLGAQDQPTRGHGRRCAGSGSACGCASALPGSGRDQRRARRRRRSPRPAWPASAAVRTSCSSRLNASTAGNGKFSSASKRANGYASSFSLICRSISAGCPTSEAGVGGWT